MDIALVALSAVLGVGQLACFVMVIVKMFQKGEKTVAIVSLVLILCGIGFLVAFVYGWIKSGEWGITNLMIVWSVLIVAGIAIQVATMGMAAGGAAL